MSGWAGRACTQYGIDHSGYCAPDSACDTDISHCHSAVFIPNFVDIECGDLKCVRPDACQLGDRVDASTLNAVCFVSTDSPACDTIQCSQRLAGWRGTVCEKYAANRQGYCNSQSRCQADISRCAIDTPREPHVACLSKECTKTCPVGELVSMVPAAQVCHTSGEGETNRNSCSQLCVFKKLA